MGPIFLGERNESRSRVYPHVRAKFGRDPTACSKKVTFKFISRCVRQSELFAACKRE